MGAALILLSLSSATFLAMPAAAGAQSIGANDEAAASAQVRPASADISATLIGLAREWVRTWNEKSVERMEQLHGDGLLYGIGDTFITGETLIHSIRRENFWNLSWSLNVKDPHVRVLGPNAALVSFRLVGQEFGADKSRPYSALFTLAFEQREGEWKIVHVHDSDCP